MSRYQVVASGCDDATYATVELTDEEVAVVRRVAQAVTDESSYGCMPRLTVNEWENRDRYGEDDE